MRELVLDISRWDANLNIEDWIKQRGLWGVIVKAGGNESNFGRYEDSWFHYFYNEACKAGIHVGAYYYTASISVEESIKDAEHFRSLLGGKKFDLPLYMSVEDPGQFKLSKRDLTDIIKAFCNKIIDYGYYSGLYTDGSAWLYNVYPEELRSYANWIAWWRKNLPYEVGDIGMWQQGEIRLSDGHIVYDDVPGYHDCNWCVIDYPSRIANGQFKQPDGFISSNIGKRS